MAGFYERRISRAATWCFRLAIVAVPFFILTIFLHRTANITTVQAFWLISFGIGMVLASLVFGLRAAADLWEKGYKGGRATVNGIALSMLLLIPFGIQLVNALENPQLNDVSTDVINPPEYFSAQTDIVPTSSEAEVYDDYVSREIVSNYPELVARRYGAPQERVIVSVLELLKRWDWNIVYSANLPKVEVLEEKSENQDDTKLAGDENEISKAAQAGENENIADMVVQVRAKSFIMKLPSDIVIRLSPVNEGTLVDMRSSSQWGRHDFGSNAENISQFLEQLDILLAGLAGEV